MTIKPKTRKVPAARRRTSNVVPFPKTIDPIFDLIDAHKRLTKECSRLSYKLDNAAFQAKKRTEAHRGL